MRSSGPQSCKQLGILGGIGEEVKLTGAVARHCNLLIAITIEVTMRHFACNGNGGDSKLRGLWYMEVQIVGQIRIIVKNKL